MTLHVRLLVGRSVGWSVGQASRAHFNAETQMNGLYCHCVLGCEIGGLGEEAG